MPGKFTAERCNEILAKKGGWHVVRSSFEHMELRVDVKNMIRYAYITGVLKRVKYSHRVRWTRALYRVCDVKYLYKPASMRWVHVVRIAKEMGIPAELLVDEEYYYNRCGLAGYRVLLELDRQGKSIFDLVDHEDFIGTVRERHWYLSWSLFIRGSVDNYTSSNYLSEIIKQVHRVLGMPVSVLCGKLPHVNGTDTSEYRTLRDDMAFMGQREVAFMAGVSKALAQCAYNKANIEPYMERLVEWYNGEEKDRSDGVDTHRGEQITFGF
ncbi:MAG: hypothetical protein PHR07_03945 [Acidaminococcaceae bacterium]|nr:hypothetical protein [Acidaminococcaceae bacterium]